ncbi:protealysin inhibitor emfourin [Quadrisphaera sp. INWT6]|uniref:protealysin inhibitor emfourin n=1 Tax=Quadrisphaera sp. INWT6 TaxID=2596917 RepID=UPI0019D5D6D0|nr:protealysin inhibitor emfourin [Quadrisphaera sp. INWT6]
MRVRVERSGGFAGVVVHGEADTADLDDEQAAQLLDLAGRVDLAALTAAPGPGRADRFRYDVEVDGHRVQVGETAVPAELRSLIDHVLRRP